MKPMTVEQEQAMAKYKIDHGFRNECNLKTWRKLWTTHQELIGALSDGSTTTGKQ
jgi:hypothetical protein